MKLAVGEDFIKEFKQRWNQRLRWLRIAGYIVGVLFIIMGLASLFSPIRSAIAFKWIIAVFILGLGIVRTFEYFMAPPIVRFSSKLISAIFNISIGVLLLYLPTDIVLTVFSYVIGFYLLITGINKLTFASQLHIFGIRDISWVIVDGVFRSIVAFIFFVMPILSVAILNVVVGLYLLIDGMSILLETADTKTLEFKKKRS